MMQFLRNWPSGSTRETGLSSWKLELLSISGIDRPSRPVSTDGLSRTSADWSTSSKGAKASKGGVKRKEDEM